MYCSKCGKEIIEGSEFCNSCGNKVGQVNVREPNKKKGLTKKQFFTYLIIIIVIVGGLGIFITSLQNDRKQKLDEANKKTQQEIRDIQGSTFDNPKGSLGEPSTYRINPSDL